MGQHHYDYQRAGWSYGSATFATFITAGAYRRAALLDPNFKAVPHVVGYGIDLDSYQPASSHGTIDAARRSLGVPEEAKVVLFAGSVAGHKGIDVVLAWARQALSDYGEGVRFVIVDDVHPGVSNAMRSLLGEALDHQRNVIWLRGVGNDRMSSVYHAADVCVMPSVWSEGFGMVALEAMASGVATLTSDSGGLGEWVDRHAAVVHPTHDLAFGGYQRLRALIDDNHYRGEIADRGRRFAETLPISQFVDSYLEVLDVYR